MPKPPLGMVDQICDNSNIAQLENASSLSYVSSFSLLRLAGWSGLLAVIRMERALFNNWTTVIYFAATPSLF
jgi:hypothetical protein